MTTMPAVFFGHGSPMNTLEDNRYTQSWQAFGARTPRPRAILAISAHWFINATAVTAMEQPRTIHDFFGFPKQLFDYEYAAPGDPALAAEVIDLVAPTWVGLDRDSWGLDHGTWSVLAHAYPAADIPVVQLAINATLPWEYHLALGRALAPLRDENVLIVGSGLSYHNLRAFGPQARDVSKAFDDWLDAAVVKGAPAERAAQLQNWAAAPAARMAHPREEHLIPLMVAVGAAEAEAGERVYHEDAFMGGLVVSSYRFGGV